MCTERKATGEYVLACLMFATMWEICKKKREVTPAIDFISATAESETYYTAIQPESRSLSKRFK